MYVLKPFFYNEFYCIGKDCPLTCCGGWNIIVDKDSYVKYEQYENDDKEMIGGTIVYNKKEDNYSFHLNQKGMCPLCDEEQLCKLVKEKGEEALCYTCRTYPREKIMTIEVEEHYVSLSCPAVAAFFWGLEEPLSFVLEEDSREIEKLENMSEEDREAVESMYETIETDMIIRNKMLDILQDRKWPLWYREFFAAYCLDKLKKTGQMGGRKAYWRI